MNNVVVTRHPALVTFLVEEGLVPESTPVLTHATAEDVAGNHVFGVLPMHLAAQAAKLTEVTLHLPAELRGVELTLEQVREHCKGVRTFVVLGEEAVHDVNRLARSEGFPGDLL